MEKVYDKNSIGVFIIFIPAPFSTQITRTDPKQKKTFITDIKRNKSVIIKRSVLARTNV